MKKEITYIKPAKSVLILFISLLLSACNGQEKTTIPSKSVVPKETQNQEQNQNSIFENNYPGEQISQVIRKIFQDSKGTIWFGTQNGVFRLRDKSLVHIDSIKSESGKNVTVKDIAEAKDGKIWFGHTDGISSIEGEKVENYYESDGLIDNDVWSIAAGAKANIWIGTLEGACRFNGQEFTSFELPEGRIDSSLGVSSGKMVHSIMEDKQGAIWFCTNAGLFSYSDKKLLNHSAKVGLQSNFVNEIFEDKKGNFWISTKDALYKLKGENLKNITEGKLKVGKGIGAIAEDKDGIIWLVSNQHYLYSYDGEKLIEFPKSEENERPVIFQIYKDQEDRLWFIGFGGAYRMENGEFINITKDGPW